MRPQGRGRLFIALDLPAAVRAPLAAWARRARRGSALVRALDPELLHVTMCFLGSRPLDEVAALGEAVAEVARPVPGLSLGAPLWLPPRRPRALSVEVHDAARELLAVHDDLVRAVSAAIDWEPEHRRYRPHVTVARMRSGAAPRERELEPTPSLEFEGEAVTLYRSFLSRDGASYEPLERVELDARTKP